MLFPMKYSNTIIECRINILRSYFVINMFAVLYVQKLLRIHKLSIFLEINNASGKQRVNP